MAHQNGVLFGLYGETECGRDGEWARSPAFRDHPDWFCGEPTGSAEHPHQDIANLFMPQVAASVESTISRMVDQHHVDLYRHDFNAPLRGQWTQTVADSFSELILFEVAEGMES